MAVFKSLVPFLLLVVFLLFASVVFFIISSIASDVARNTQQKMKNKNVTFSKEGMRVGVKEVGTESYVDQSQG
jgi:uncharacterized protein (UPF0333 family)